MKKSEVRRNLSGITAVILAGGLGIRLRPVVVDRPKVLAEVRGRPFLEYILDQLIDAGIRDVVLCTGYLGGQIQNFFGDAYKTLHLVYSQELSPRGTAGALCLAKPSFRSDPVLVMNGDSFCQIDLQAFYMWYCERGADCALIATKVPDMQRYGRINSDASGRILNFEEKGSKVGPGWINAGIYLLSQNLLSKIPESDMVSLERDVFPCWIGHRFYAYCTHGAFLDIGTPESYVAAKQFFSLNEESLMNGY